MYTSDANNLEFNFNVILIKFAEYAQLEVYNFEYSQHDLPFIRRKPPRSTSNTITVPIMISYYVHNIKFHNIQVFSLSGP
jgi:hypothetical protein